MEVDSNTAQVEALMNLIRSTYPQIVQELSQLSNTASDGEPPWKKQRVDRTYANNDNRGDSKNVLGDVYKHSVVNNISLAFNFTLASGNSQMIGFDTAKPGNHSSASRHGQPRVGSHALRRKAAKPPDSPQVILVNGTAPAEMITDPQLLRKGFQAQSRLMEIHHGSESHPNRQLDKQPRRLRKLSALLGISRWTTQASNEQMNSHEPSLGLEDRDKDFFIPGRIFDAQYELPEDRSSYRNFHFAPQSPFKFLVIHKGLYCCSVVPVVLKQPKSVRPGFLHIDGYLYAEDQRAFGSFCQREFTNTIWEAPYCDKALRLIDVDAKNFPGVDMYEFNYSTVYTIDVTIRARTLARVADDSLSDLDAQFNACWGHDVGRNGLQRRNSALD